MDTRQVRYFLALCEEQSFTRAAKRCGVSQPSISTAIRRLEKELGGSLFRRSIKRTKMSPLGIAVRPYLQQIDNFAEKAKLQATTDPTPSGLFFHDVMNESRQKMRKQSRIDGLALPEFGALLVVWLLFYGLLVVHGVTTSEAQRLAKAWTVQDNTEGVPGEAQAVRASLSLYADKTAH